MSLKNFLPTPPRHAKFWYTFWAAVFLAIFILSILTPLSLLTTIVKLGSVFVCLLYAVLYSPSDYLLILAIIITCIADLLLAIGDAIPLGVTVFIGAQIFHFAHLAELRGRRYLYKYCYLYAAFCIFLITLNYFTHFLEPLFLSTPLYATALLANIITSILWAKNSRNSKNLTNPTSSTNSTNSTNLANSKPSSSPPESKASPSRHLPALACLGFLLFGGCDFCSGLSYLSLTGVIPRFLYTPINVLVWVFYYPSQIFLSNTGKYDIMEQKEGKNSQTEVYGI